MANRFSPWTFSLTDRAAGAHLRGMTPRHARFALALVAVGCGSSPALVGDAPIPNTPAALEPSDASAAKAALCPQYECPEGRTTCPGENRCATDLLADVANCGVCGNACLDLSYVFSPLFGQTECRDGVCKLTCDSGSFHADCNNRPEDGCEASLFEDSSNCGACGHSCAPGELCVGGHCGCPEGLSECTDVSDPYNPVNVCVDITVDRAHCGKCNRPCDQGPAPAAFEDHICVAGACVCPPGKTECPGYGPYGDPSQVCVDIMSDDANCGGCGQPCPAPPEPPSPRAWATTPPAHMYYGCVEGTCGASGLNPPPPTRPIHPASPPEKNLKCASLYYGLEAWSDCDNDRANGCEAHTGFYLMDFVPPHDPPDNNNCGACGVVVPPGGECFYDYLKLNATNHLEAYTSCPAGLAACPLYYGCRDLSSDPDHCGTCSHACGGNALFGGLRDLCVQGECQSQCPFGVADCNGIQEDGCEVDIRSSPEHCGACGNACLSGQPCVDGLCLVGPCAGGIQ